MEALFIKSFKPELNNGLKASKELSLFELTLAGHTIKSIFTNLAIRLHQ